MKRWSPGCRCCARCRVSDDFNRESTTTSTNDTDPLGKWTFIGELDTRLDGSKLILAGGFTGAAAELNSPILSSDNWCMQVKVNIGTSNTFYMTGPSTHIEMMRSGGYITIDGCQAMDNWTDGEHTVKLCVCKGEVTVKVDGVLVYERALDTVIAPDSYDEPRLGSTGSDDTTVDDFFIDIYQPTDPDQLEGLEECPVCNKDETCCTKETGFELVFGETDLSSQCTETEGCTSCDQDSCSSLPGTTVALGEVDCDLSPDPKECDDDDNEDWDHPLIYDDNCPCPKPLPATLGVTLPNFQDGATPPYCSDCNEVSGQTFILHNQGSCQWEGTFEICPSLSPCGDPIVQPCATPLSVSVLISITGSTIPGEVDISGSVGIHYEVLNDPFSFAVNKGWSWYIYGVVFDCRTGSINLPFQNMYENDEDFCIAGTDDTDAGDLQLFGTG